MCNKISGLFAMLAIFSLLMQSKASPSPSFLTENGECTIKVETIVEIKGKCVRLRGGKTACQSDQYLDVINDGCDESEFD